MNTVNHRHKQLVMKTAINEYRLVSSDPFANKKSIVNAINMMENAYLMGSQYNTPGNAELKLEIEKAKEKWKELLDDEIS